MCRSLSFTAGFTYTALRRITKEGGKFTSSWDTAGLNAHKSHSRMHKVGHRTLSTKMTERGGEEGPGMNSCGSREGSIERVCVQGPELCAQTWHKSLDVNTHNYSVM